MNLTLCIGAVFYQRENADVACDDKLQATGSGVAEPGIMGESLVSVLYLGDGDNWNNFHTVGLLTCHSGKLLDASVYRQI